MENWNDVLSAGEGGGWNVFLHRQSGRTQTQLIGGTCGSASGRGAKGEIGAPVSHRCHGDLARSPARGVGAAGWRLRLYDTVDVDQGRLGLPMGFGYRLYPSYDYDGYYGVSGKGIDKMIDQLIAKHDELPALPTDETGHISL
jgi:hypothetical protein